MSIEQYLPADLIGPYRTLQHGRERYAEAIKSGAIPGVGHNVVAADMAVRAAEPLPADDTGCCTFPDGTKHPTTRGVCGDADGEFASGEDCDAAGTKPAARGFSVVGWSKSKATAKAAAKPCCDSCSGAKPKPARTFGGSPEYRAAKVQDDDFRKAAARGEHDISAADLKSLWRDNAATRKEFRNNFEVFAAYMQAKRRGGLSLVGR